MPAKPSYQASSGKILAIFLLVFVLTAVTVLFSQDVSPAPAKKGCQGEQCYTKIVRSGQAQNYWPLQKNLQPVIGRQKLKIIGNGGIKAQPGRAPGQGRSFWRLAADSRESALQVATRRLTALSLWIRPSQQQSGVIVSRGQQQPGKKSAYWSLEQREDKLVFSGQKADRAWLCAASRPIAKNQWSLLSLLSKKDRVEVFINDKRVINCQHSPPVSGALFFGAAVSSKKIPLTNPGPGAAVNEPSQPEIDQPADGPANDSLTPEQPNVADENSNQQESLDSASADVQESGIEIPGNILDIPPDAEDQEQPVAADKARQPSNEEGGAQPAKQAVVTKKVLGNSWAGDITRLALWSKTYPSPGMIAVIKRSGWQRVEVRKIDPEPLGAAGRISAQSAPQWAGGTWTGILCNGASNTGSTSEAFPGDAALTTTELARVVSTNSCASTPYYAELIQSGGSISIQRGRFWRWTLVDNGQSGTGSLDVPRVFYLETKESRFQRSISATRSAAGFRGWGSADGLPFSNVVSESRGLASIAPDYPATGGSYWVRDDSANPATGKNYFFRASSLGVRPLENFSTLELYGGVKCYSTSDPCTANNQTWRFGPVHVYYISAPNRKDDSLEITTDTPDSSITSFLGTPIISLGKTDTVLKCNSQLLPADAIDTCASSKYLFPLQQVRAPGGLTSLAYFSGGQAGVEIAEDDNRCIKNNGIAWNPTTGQSTSTPCPVWPTAEPGIDGGPYLTLPGTLNNNQWYGMSVLAEESRANTPDAPAQRSIFVSNNTSSQIGRYMIDSSAPAITWTSGGTPQVVSNTSPTLSIDGSDAAGLERVIWGRSLLTNPSGGQCTANETTAGTGQSTTTDTLSNALPTSASASRQFTGLSNGGCYTFRARVEDRIGGYPVTTNNEPGAANYSTTSYRTYLIDTTAPAVGAISCTGGAPNADRDSTLGTTWFTAAPTCTGEATTTNGGFTNGRSAISSGQFERGTTGGTCAAPGSWSNQTTTLASGTVTRNISASPSTTGQYCLRAAATSAAALTTATGDRPTTQIGIDSTAPTITAGTIPTSPQAGTISFGASTVSDSTSRPRKVQIQYKLTSAGSNAWALLPSTSCADQTLAGTSSPITGSTCSFDTTLFGDGEYDFRIRALDTAGNVQTATLDAKPGAGTSLIIRNSISATVGASSDFGTQSPNQPTSGTSSSDKALATASQSISVLAGKAFNIDACVTQAASAERFRTSGGTTFPSGYPLQIQRTGGSVQNLSKTCSALASNQSATDDAVNVPFVLKQNLGWPVGVGSYTLPLQYVVAATP